MKYQPGQWVKVLSPLKDDINKKTRKGQEVRFGLIIDYNEETEKYKVQMFTTKNKYGDNWTFTMKDGKQISSRKHYLVNVKVNFIIRRISFWNGYKDLDNEELIEIRKLAQPGLYNT